MTSGNRSPHEESARRAFQAGDYRVALTHAMESVRADPTCTGMMVCAGECLIRLGDERAGLAVLKRAVRTSPFDIDALAGAAHAARLCGQPELATELADRALGLEPNAARPACVRAAILRTSGRADEAAAFFKPFLDRAPDDPARVIEWADICRATDNHDDGIERLERALASERLTPPARRSLLYRLAHLLDEQDRCDEAFLAADRANPEPTRDAVVPAAAIASMWSPATLESIPRARERAPVPILIVGMPRSGTTLTARMLARHPRVGSAGESPMLGAAARELHQLGRPPTQAWCDEQAGRYLDALERAAPGADAVVDKMPGNFMNLGVVSRLLPNARVIHCRRDPRDVCLSCYFQPFSAALEFTQDLVQCARQCVAKDQLMDHWRRTTDLRILDLAYEHLAADPEREIRRVLDHIGLPFDEACRHPQDARQHETTASWSRVSRTVTTERVGRWKRYAPHLKPMLDWLDSQREPASR